MVFRKDAKVKGRKSPGPGRFTISDVPDTFDAILYEIGRMVDFVIEWHSHPDIAAFAQNLVVRCKERDALCELGTIFKFMQKHTRFVQDPYDAELLKTPHRMIREMTEGAKIASGDCDDLSTTLAALVASLGWEPVFMFGASSGEKNFHHVWVGAIAMGRIYEMDLSVKKLRFNQRFPGFAKIGFTRIFD